jgi:hypothetical protein
MKNLIIMLLVVILSYPAMAQDETLISGEVESGGYGAPIFKVGQINGTTGVFVGGQGGWIINHSFVLGGKGYGLANNVDIEGSQNLKLEFGCGGVLLEYIFSSDKLLHVGLNAMIGAGGARYVVKDYTNGYDDVNYTSSSFFVLEPGINLVLNVSSYFRIGAGATYRYVSGVEYEGLSNSNLSGATGEIVFKFGSF